MSSDERGQRGHDQPPEAPGLDRSRRRGALHDDEPEEPGEEEPGGRHRPAGDRDRCRPAGRNWITRALQVNSRRFDMFCCHVSSSRRTVRSNQLVAETPDRVAEPGGKPHCLSLREERHLAEAPRLPDRQRDECGGERRDEEQRCVQRRARASATSGPARNSAFAGLSASATPANVPASTASGRAPARSARTVSATETSTATTDGKSACCVSPSACGRNWSTHESW